MSKEPIDVILKVLTQDLKKGRTPLVGNNPHKKYISITYDFDFGEIPKIKLMVPRDKLQKWYYDDAFTGKLTFEVIKKYLSKNTAKRKKANLRQYASNRLADFQTEILHCVNYAIGKHPQINIQPRGGQPYGIDKKKMWEIKTASRQLYAYLKYWLNKNPKDYPEDLRALISRNNIRSKYPEDVTMEIIDKEFPVGLSKGIDDPKTFYKKYISFMPITTLLKSPRIITGETPFLKKILS